MTMFVAALVASGGLLLTQSGKIISLSGKSANERTMMNAVIQDFNTALASRDACSAARANNYDEIGGYERGDRIDEVGLLGGGAMITVSWPGPPDLPLPLAGPIPGGVPLTDVRVLRLNFTIDNRDRGVRQVPHDIYIQDFVTNVDEGAAVESFCMAFQLTGAESAIDRFCDETIAGALNPDGTCNLENPFEPSVFKSELKELACAVLGGQDLDNDGRCDLVDVDGPIHSANFFNANPGDQIVLDDTATLRTDISDFSCGALEVATGFNDDGTLSCNPVDCNATFTNSNLPVFSTYNIVDTGSGLQCQCQKDFKFGTNVHNVTLDDPVDSNRYNTGSEAGADMHSMISPWKRPGDYNGTYATNNNGAVGCNDNDPYACRDYDWNDGCAMGTTCKILRGRYPGCGVTTTSDEKIIINSCNDICAVGPNCDGTDTDFTGTRADGCTVENDPSPPDISCTGQTLPGSCTVSDAGAGSLGVSGTCGGGTTGNCSADCSATGSWENIDVTTCAAAVSACSGLPNSTEYNNSNTCETNGGNPNYYTCEVRSGKFCRLGRSCDRSTLSVPNATVTSSFGWDDANQPYGGTVACDDSSAPPSVTCNGSSGNYDIAGTCGSGVTCASGNVSWNSGNCQGNIPAIYSQGSIVNVVDSASSMQGDADFECLNTGAWEVLSGDPETCSTTTITGEYCSRSDLSFTGSGAAPGRGVTWIPASVSSPKADEPSSYSVNLAPLPYSGQSCNVENQFLRSSETSATPGDDKYFQCITAGTCSTKDCDNSDPSISFSNASWSNTGWTEHGESLGITCNSGYSGSPTASCSNSSWATSGSCVASNTACQDVSSYNSNIRIETANALATNNRPNLNSCKAYCDSVNAWTCNYGPGTTCRPYGPGSPLTVPSSGSVGTVCGPAPTSRLCEVDSFTEGNKVISSVTAKLAVGETTSHSKADDTTYSVVCSVSGTPTPYCDRTDDGVTVTYSCQDVATPVPAWQVMSLCGSACPGPMVFSSGEAWDCTTGALPNVPEITSGTVGHRATATSCGYSTIGDEGYASGTCWTAKVRCRMGAAP